MDAIDDALESIELMQEEIQWALSNDWSKEWLKAKLRDFSGRLLGIQNELTEVGLMREEA